METIADDLKINYTVAGEGTPIFLLHGWGGSIQSLTPLQKIISSKGFKAYNFDLPGFGESDKPEGAFSLDDYAAIFEKIIKQENIKEIVLFGHSFGGSISIKLASRGRISIKKLILCNSSGIRLPLGRKVQMLGTFSKIAKLIFSLPVLKSVYKPIRKFFYYYILKNRDYIDHPGVSDTFKRIIKEDLTTDLEKINVPTLLLWGELDKDTPIGHGKIMHSLIQNSKFIILKNVGHGLPLQKPDLVAEKTREFVL